MTHDRPERSEARQPRALKRIRGLFLSAAPLVAGLLFSDPSAGATYQISIDTPMNLGSVVAAPSGNTVFRISPTTGAAPVISGAGRRISTSSARSQVTLTCKPASAADLDCQTKKVILQIGPIGSVTGRARPLNLFSVSTGTVSIIGPPNGANAIAVQMQAPGNNTPRTFFVGADFPVAGDDSNLPTGPGQNGFYVSVLGPNGAVVSTDADVGLVVVYRALAIAKTADLNFGRIQTPTSGTSTVSLDAATGVRSITGSAFGYPTPAPTRAAFSITGEGGQQVSLSVPSSFDLIGPSTLTVTVSDTAPNAPSLSGVVGSAGSYNFTVGGAFSIFPATPPGSYAGVLTVSVDYN